MAKRFFYMCLGILVLVIAFAIGAQSVRGQAGQFRMLNETAAVVGDKVYHLDSVNQPVGWREMPYGSFVLPPVPVSSLVALSDNFADAVTDNGEGWTRQNGVFVSLGILPGVTGVENTTWGEVKARYRR